MKTNSEKELSNENPDITGIDLQIDKSIDKLCEVSNSTSGNIRSVWSIIVIVSTLSFAEFWNTQPFNYPAERLQYIRETIKDLEISLDKKDTTDKSELTRSLEYNKDLLELLHSNYISNFQIVKIPILGNTFDIIDLGIFAGFSFIVLLLILKYMLMRKVRNLKIAFIAVTKRYTDNADENFFKDYLDKNNHRTKILKAINYTRRKYHYNVLYMNEIYNNPGEVTDVKSTVEKIIVFLSNHIVYIPFVMSILLFLNHIANLFINRWSFYKENDIFLIIINIVYLILIYMLSKKCADQSNKLEELYDIFQKKNYRFTE
ncbi:MAG: hypothetical protein M3R36_16935 [Bacteroidota bacterium]|nr:hypothetical protein [Bacteroidota bacterium]